MRFVSRKVGIVAVRASTLLPISAGRGGIARISQSRLASQAPWTPKYATRQTTARFVRPGTCTTPSTPDRVTSQGDIYSIDVSLAVLTLSKELRRAFARGVVLAALVTNIT